jgi:hypothetical protein
VDFSRSVLNPIRSDLRPIHSGLNRSVLNRSVLNRSVLNRSVLNPIRLDLNPILFQAAVDIGTHLLILSHSDLSLILLQVVVVAVVAGIEIHLLDRMFSANQIILHKQADERRDKNQNLANPM